MKQLTQYQRDAIMQAAENLTARPDGKGLFTNEYKQFALYSILLKAATFIINLPDTQSDAVQQDN